MTRLAVDSFTPLAREWLSATPSARVLNVFDRACNLINQNDRILALVTSERGLTPFGMVVVSEERTPFRAVTPSSVVKVETDRLRVGPLEIHLGSAALWNPIPDWVAVRELFADPVELLDALLAMAVEVAPEGSLLDLAPRPLARLLTRTSVSGEGESAKRTGVRQNVILDRVRQGAIELATGLQTGSFEQSILGAKTLAGLGGGLTPAGDDFIVGVLLAVWAGLFGVGREQLVVAIAETAAPLTTALSAAYLQAAARGECMIHWHDLFEALLASDEQAVRAAIRALTSVGHTSGADALAGFLFVGWKEFFR